MCIRATLQKLTSFLKKVFLLFYNFILLSLIISHTISHATFSYKIERSCALVIEMQILQSPTTPTQTLKPNTATIT